MSVCAPTRHHSLPWRCHTRPNTQAHHEVADEPAQPLVEVVAPAQHGGGHQRPVLRPAQLPQPGEQPADHDDFLGPRVPGGREDQHGHAPPGVGEGGRRDRDAHAERVRHQVEAQPRDADQRGEARRRPARRGPGGCRPARRRASANPARSSRYAASAPHAASCSALVSWNARSTRLASAAGAFSATCCSLSGVRLQQGVEQGQRAAERGEAERDRQDDEDLGADEPALRRIGDHRDGGGPRRAPTEAGHDRTLPRGVTWPGAPAAPLPALDHVASAHPRRDGHVRPAGGVAVGAGRVGHGQPAQRRLRVAVAALRRVLRRDVVPHAAPGGAAPRGGAARGGAAAARPRCPRARRRSPPGPPGVEPITDETDPELAAYNRMLAVLAEQDRERENRTR